MSDGQKTFWLSTAFVVVIAIGGVTLWEVTNDTSAETLAALNAKIEQTNATLARVQKATSSGAMTRSLDQLEDNIKSTNKALAEIQRTIAAGNVRDRLDTLEKSIKSIDASLTSVQKSLPPADLASKVAAIDSTIKALDGKLAEAPKSVDQALGEIKASLKSTDASIAALKQAMPQKNLADQINPLNDQIKSLNGTLADIQKSTSLDGVKKQLAALSNKLETTNKAVAGGSQPKEAVVFYLHMPNAENLPQKVASISPLDIQFEKIGSTDDNGQAAVIIPKLKALVEGRSGCSISVAGYADTVGGDKVNLKISQKRARNIAQKIKEAFAGSEVQVNEAAWGERRLKNWTPDGTADENNRRVDIAVNCKS